MAWRTGIIGVGGYGRAVLPELAKNEQFTICAIGDQNAELAKELVKPYGGNAYDDYRSLIAQESLEVLFLFLPTYLCEDCIRRASQKKIHVFKDAPLARTVPEGMQWVDWMKKSGCQFCVGVQRRFSPSYLESHQLIQAGAIGEIYLIRGEMLGRFPGELGWRGDPVLAGGGVLLEWGCHFLDMALWNVGLPIRVFGQRESFWSKQSLPPYKTEDTMTLNLKFNQNAIGIFTFAWQTTPPSEQIVYHGSEATLIADPRSIRIFDKKGLMTQEEFYDVDESWLIRQQLRQFAASLEDPQQNLFSPAEQHLATIATIESAYLSVRTQLPETLQVYGPKFSFGQ